jgi:hypothetical protein
MKNAVCLSNRCRKGTGKGQKPMVEAVLSFIDLLERTSQLEAVIELAEDTDTHGDILAVLSAHPDVRIRAAVADNLNTPYLALLKLARDESNDIRYQLAENHNVPRNILHILMNDENPYVQARAESTLDRLGAFRLSA